jgi:hypothetical protein
MSDADFEIKKAELAQQLAPPSRPPAEGRAFDERVADYLLYENLVPIYQARLAGAQATGRAPQLPGNTIPKSEFHPARS